MSIPGQTEPPGVRELIAISGKKHLSYQPYPTSDMSLIKEGTPLTFMQFQKKYLANTKNLKTKEKSTLQKVSTLSFLSTCIRSKVATSLIEDNVGMIQIIPIII